MSRVQLALRVADLDGSVAFYSNQFGVQPAKRRPGYANFAIEEPPLKLVLIEGAANEPTVMDHICLPLRHSNDRSNVTIRLSEDVSSTLSDSACPRHRVLKTTSRALIAGC